MYFTHPSQLNSLSYDVVIAGSGPAAFAFANGISNKQQGNVLVVEGGYSKANPHSQSVYKGTLSGLGHAELHLYRKRQLGGSSNCWGGGCVPFDEIDFQLQQDKNKHWPISLQELIPYYLLAGKLYGIGDYYDQTGKPRVFRDTIPGLRQSYWLVKNKAKNFTEPFLNLAKDNHLDICCNASLIDVGFNEGSRLNSIYIKGLDGFELKICCDKLIICAGGIESTRLLMNFAESHKQFDLIKKLIGRYYSPHININGGKVIARKQHLSQAGYISLGQGISSRGFFSPSFVNSEQDLFLNSKMTLESDEISLPQRIRHAITADMGLIANGKNPSGKHGNLAAYIDEGYGTKEYTINAAFDQTPCINSALMLTDERDQLGLKRVNLNFDINPEDVMRITNTYLRLAHVLGSHGVGRVKVPNVDSIIKSNELGRSHHIGTLRMSSSAETGCVDKDLKVHGIENIWVCSSAVFPTPSHANPTFTIMALGLRLAHHLYQA